ncbi:MAG: DNA polymerase/3'-5' exonuclease PolX [Bacteroidetes bacterium]|nr:MAG: DNA polymerase/3'-5' exonuclease PolX [Bacteroidota bacterium]
MTNKEIARAFDELADLLELHEDNEFKIRSYRNAYRTLRKLERPLAELSDAEIKGIKGIGPAISGKIRELLTGGKMKALEEARAKTPLGVVEMLRVNGFGPKKVRVVWQEMEIETIGELWYACNENRLVEYKGFGLKTQEDLKSKLEYYLRSKDKLHYDAAAEDADFIGAWLTGKLAGAFVSPVGAVRRCCPVVDHLEILVGFNGELTPVFDGEALILEQEREGVYEARLENNTPVRIHRCLAEEFGSKLFQLTGAPAFVDAFVRANPGLSFKGLRTEQEVFEKAGLPYIVPELREPAESTGGVSVLDLATSGKLPVLVEEQDIRGVLHVHTTWSDGLHSLQEMCAYARELGYAYIGVTDHSQSAFYANGLKPDRVLAQMEEIDALNAEMAPFRILKGIESDILYDGALDYPDEILQQFDFVIASVHSNLKMDREKATERIIRAIENPHTRILGHPTGRLLLSREGYPLDWEAVLDACARHNVAVELNAHPYRLDIDWTLIPEAVKRGIKISINPDAHSKEGIHDIRYGVLAARKGRLTAADCLNTTGDLWMSPK